MQPQQSQSEIDGAGVFASVFAGRCAPFVSMCLQLAGLARSAFSPPGSRIVPDIRSYGNSAEGMRARMIEVLRASALDAGFLS
jgi:hypothetical protein